MKTAVHFCAISVLYVVTGLFAGCSDPDKQPLPKAALAAQSENIEKEEIAEPLLVRQFSGCKAHQ